MCKMPCFRERLNELLSDSGKTIIAFAEFLGTSRQSLGYYLNGERIPDALMVKQFCERCHVSADWLLGLSDVKTPDSEVQAICKTTGLSEATISLLVFMSKNPDNQLLMKLIDAFLSNKESRSSLIISLMYLYQAYRVKKRNLDTFSSRIIEISEEIKEIDELKKTDILDNRILELQFQVLSGNDKEEFEQFLSKKNIQEALDALFKSDDLEGIYQWEESNNGEP